MPSPTGPWYPAMYPHRADHYAVTEGRNRTGTMRPAVPSTPTATGVPCSVQEMTPFDAPGGTMAVQSRTMVGIYYPADPGLTANDQVKIPATGRVYVVVDVVEHASPSGAAEAHEWMAQCNRTGT